MNLDMFVIHTRLQEQERGRRHLIEHNQRLSALGRQSAPPGIPRRVLATGIAAARRLRDSARAAIAPTRGARAGGTAAKEQTRLT
jgi:hypothetical protein